jgi:site-specific DNA recombinase
MRKPKASTSTKVRCAIYTRKSTEEGVELEFNSLDAQRESAGAFIASQQHEGWVCLPEHYDDGGYSGGNMDRPALNRLLSDIAAGKVDCVVVYKVDRLSRSLMDFARIMEAFDRHGVSFVSVTQQFNTTHSMGRLTLNVLLSFAQFEREIIVERIRDKIAGLCIIGFQLDGLRVVGDGFVEMLQLPVGTAPHGPGACVIRSQLDGLRVIRDRGVELLQVVVCTSPVVPGGFVIRFQCDRL